MVRKSYEEQDIENIVRAQAANTAMWQKQAQAAAEMKAWVEAGHFDFIQQRIFAPIELECFKKVKSIKLGPTGIANIARVQGTLEVFDKISGRIANAIQSGEDALAHLKDLENSTPKEGE